MTSPTPLLEMRGIKKRFGATIALDGVDLQVAAGEVLALVGENGAGKSTLMKVLSGAHAPDEGQMILGEQNYAPKDPLEARRRGVAMIYQELSLAPHLTAAENILLGVEPNTGGVLKRGEMQSVARDALNQVGLSHVSPNTQVALLSVAERQLVEIARAIALNSRVLVFDEPTSSLTQRDIVRLFELVKRLREQGQAIIYISHFLEEVRELSDRFTVLRDGRSVGGGVTSQAKNSDIIAMMVGRSVEDLYPRSVREPGEVVLEVEHLQGAPKPQNASLQLRRGEVVGIAGLVGAGRTEFLRAIFGLDAVKRGKVTLGHFTGNATPAQRWNQGLGMVSEDRKIEGLALNLGINENLTMTKLPAFFNPAQRDKEATTWADKLFVKRRAVTQPIGDLSGGNQQKVAIARLLYHGCDVLLLDEPTRGIDVGSKTEIYRVIDELAREGRAIIIVSSYLPELLGTCDRIAVMCRGVLGEAKPIAQVTEHSIMVEATGTEVHAAEIPHAEAA
ncbi:sugar ABC transporter ATP-binding protein [bacterium]|nr:MAG: sugar ABC transporter ATP-binding protein [bacterium]